MEGISLEIPAAHGVLPSPVLYRLFVLVVCLGCFVFSCRFLLVVGLFVRLVVSSFVCVVSFVCCFSVCWLLASVLLLFIGLVCLFVFVFFGVVFVVPSFLQGSQSV